jgi:hypothetical protein
MNDIVCGARCIEQQWRFGQHEAFSDVFYVSRKRFRGAREMCQDDRGRFDIGAKYVSQLALMLILPRDVEHV